MHLVSFVAGCCTLPASIALEAQNEPTMFFLFFFTKVPEEGQTCEGVAQKDRGMCRMDILESQMDHLGYDATESYGITWKVCGHVDTLLLSFIFFYWTVLVKYIGW